MTDKHKPDKVVEGMLRRKAVWPGAVKPESCPDAATLAAYFERSLIPAETSHWEAHFSACSRCQAQLAALVRSERPAQATLAGEERRAFWWLWNWRFLAPVGAAAIVVLAFVISHQTMRAPAGTTGGALMAKRDVATPAQPATEPAKSVAVPEQKPEQGRAVLDELRDKKTAHDQTQARANLSLADKRATKSPAGPSGGGFGALAQPSAGANQIAAAAAPGAPVQQAPPTAGVMAQAETAKSQARAVEADRQQVAPAPSAADTVAVQTIQEKERAAKIEARKARADQATSVVQLKREASGAQEGAATRQAPARSASGAAGGLAGQLLAAPGEFIVTTPNPKVLWRFGASGLIERSRDAGKTWERQTSPERETLLSGSAPSDKICWVGGKNGILLRTTDGGEKWEPILSPTQSDILAVKALDQLHVTVTDADGRSFESLNAGRLWRTL